MSRLQFGHSKMKLSELADALHATTTDQELFGKIVNAPFAYRKDTVKMSLGIIVFLQVNKARRTIDRLALSENELAEGTKTMSAKKFEEIRIPIDNPENSLATAIREDEPQVVSDWKYLFMPALTAEQARLNQAGGGIGCSVVYPLNGARDGGAMIFSFFKYASNIVASDHDFMRGYADLVIKELAATR